VIPDANSEFQIPNSKLLCMKFVHLYLIGYFTLLAGAALALWNAGVLARVDATWLAISIIIAVGLGIVLAVTAVRPTRV
jgi:hypothetical protein